MVAIMVASFEDVRKARQRVQDLAQAAGLEDPGAAALVTRIKRALLAVSSKGERRAS
jgi:hypothetical protein